MGLGRLLLIVLLAGLAYLVYQRYIRKLIDRHKDPQHDKKKINKTVRCQHCQLHLPEHEAIQHHGRYYCSQEHLEKDVQ